jgi:hypothetical protein
MKQMRGMMSRVLGVFGLLMVLAVPPAFARVFPVDPVGLQVAIAAQERHTDALMGVEGVVGTAVGARLDGKPVIKIYTEAAGVAGLPRMLDGVPVVVEVTGKIYARAKPPGTPGNGPGGGGDGGGGDAGTTTNLCDGDPTARCERPVPIGVSTGHPAITAGTICCRVTDGTNVYALSNNHVYADENQAKIGDAALQPGAYDGGSSSVDDIGTLAEFSPIDFSGGNNTIDAAIALSSTGDLGNATPSDGYGTPKSDPVQAAVGMRVRKYGRTTGQTNGRIDAINATINVGYDSGVARFVGQIIIRPGGFSAGGDSGSLIVARGGSNDGKPVGLLFAGSSIFTVANPIGAVLDHFGVQIDGL